MKVEVPGGLCGQGQGIRGSAWTRVHPTYHWPPAPASLLQIYEAQPDISRAFQTREFVPLPRLLAMVMVTTAPVVCTKTMFTQALNVSGCPRFRFQNLLLPTAARACFGECCPEWMTLTCLGCS